MSLREQHRAGKAAIVQPGERRRLLQFIRHFIRQDFTVLAARQFHARCLQVPVWLIACAVLAPESTVGGAFHFKFHFRQALCGITRHEIVLCLRHFLQARCFVVERQADGIKQGGFTCARGTGNGKKTVAGKWLSGKVDLPLALE